MGSGFGFLNVQKEGQFGIAGLMPGIEFAVLLLLSHSVVSDSFQPRGLQHARLPCPSPAPGVCSNSSIESVTIIYQIELFQ